MTGRIAEEGCRQEWVDRLGSIYDRRLNDERFIREVARFLVSRERIMAAFKEMLREKTQGNMWRWSFGYP